MLLHVSLFILLRSVAAAELANNPGTKAIVREAQAFCRDPTTLSYMRSSKALQMRIADIQATLGNISYQIGYLLKTQKFHSSELRALM